jgi:hypothetical protein
VTQRWDVFVSYAHEDEAGVQVLAGPLGSCLRPVRDQRFGDPAGPTAALLTRSPGNSQTIAGSDTARKQRRIIA